ncbi:polycomb complex protein BMI-1-A-like isoform X2 [Apostichopus japonicus]|uniref:polycomb complex protein BMI-1-A-like isoform X2 n=1 Tax=Stichopus japonicus TaxID=307972 RepID=UPI003AB905B1
MHRKTRIKMTDLNPLLTCKLCKGYLIDATTLTECLHSFCRSCLVRYLCTSIQCPTCDTPIHKTRPLLNARVDRDLQNVVYKLTPGLFKDEMKKRRDFYSEHPIAVNSTTTNMEDRGEVSEQPGVIYSDDETMTLSLEYYVPSRQQSAKWSNDGNRTDSGNYGDGQTGSESDKNEIEVTHFDDEDDSLPDDYTLMDVAYIYAWHKSGPLPLFFRIFHTIKRQKTSHETLDGCKMAQDSYHHSSDLPTSEEEPPRLKKEPQCVLKKDEERKDDRVDYCVTFDPSKRSDDDDKESATGRDMKVEDEFVKEKRKGGNNEMMKGDGVDYHREELEPSDKEALETPPTLTRIETT